MTDLGMTHYDPVEAQAVCHSECAIAEIERLRDDNAKLRAELAALEQVRADARRLDWLEANGAAVRSRPPKASRNLICWYRDWTIREAIDWAMAALARKDAV